MQFATGLGIATSGLIYNNVAANIDGLSIINPVFNNSIPVNGAVVGSVANGGFREPIFSGWNQNDLPASAIAVNIVNASSAATVTLTDGIIEAANRAVNAGGSISGTTIMNASTVTVQGASTWSSGPLWTGVTTVLGTSNTIVLTPNSSSLATIAAGKVGGGSYLPLVVNTNNTNYFRWDLSGNYLPETDNTQNVGSAAKRIQTEYLTNLALGTSLVLGAGASQSLSGFIRASNNGSSLITARNAANSQDVVVVGIVDGSNNVILGDGVNGAQLQLRAIGQVKSIANNVTIGTTVGTFAQLPGSPTDGDCKAISDSMTATYLAIITGSGTNHVIACYNGTNWVAH
jgi:hypothetical protein